MGMPGNDMDVDMDVAEDEREVKGIISREVDGEEWLFTPEALAKFELMRVNMRLRGEEMDEEMSEFSENKEYGDLVDDAGIVESSEPSQNDDGDILSSSQPTLVPSTAVRRGRGGRCECFF